MDTWQEPKTLAIYLSLVLIFVFILITAIIIAVRISLSKTIKAKENEARMKLEHQQRLLENSILTQERERARIAADIHDELIGKLTAIKMTNQIKEKSQEMDDLISKGIQIARRISHDLMPPLIEYSSLEDLIKETIQPWQNKLTIDMTSNNDKNLSISSEIKIHFVRIIQEVLVNTAKHSNAENVHIHLRISPKWIGMNISDNGVGFDINSIKHGLGLSNIETRVQYLKGNYKLRSSSTHGTGYVFLVPTVVHLAETL